MIQDALGLFTLLWPGLFVLLGLMFLAGIMFALSVGSAFAIGVLLVYYGYLALKKRGFFTWLLSKQQLLGEKVLGHVQETFQLRGNLEVFPNEPILFIAHPHGLFSMAPFLHWVARVTRWPFDRTVRIAIHSIFFSIPLVREAAESLGAIEATDEEIRKVLKSGDSVALLTGGVRELNETVPGKMRLVLKKRKGFARVAHELGVPIVPVLTFGENELFPPLRGFWTSAVQKHLHTWFGVSVPLPTWASIKNWFSLLQGPLEPPVETWIGTPIFPADAKNQTILHEKVIQGFTELYIRGKPKSFSGALEIL